MKQIKKKILVVLLLVTIGLTFSGCLFGGSDEPEPVPSGGIVPTDRQITLIWWNLFESKENMQPVIDAYQAKYPNVTIEYSEKSLDDYQTNLEKVLTDGIPESTPDIFTVHSSQIGRYKNYTIAAPNEVLDAATFQKDFYPVVYENCVKGGYVRNIPLGVDSLAIIYNKDLLQTNGYSIPSDDWTELQEQALAMTVENGDAIDVAGMSLGAYDNSESWFDLYNLLLMQSGVSMLNAAGTEAVFGTDEAAAEVAVYLREFEDKKIWNKDVKTDIGLFLEGKLAMFIAPSWRLLDVISYNETYNLGINYGVAPLPQLSTLEEESTGWATYWTETVSVDSKEYKVAWDFLNFATQPDQLKLLSQKAGESRPFGQMSPRVDMRSEVELDEDLAVYIDEVATAKSWNMVDGSQIKQTFAKWVSNDIDATEAQAEVSKIITSGGVLQRTVDTSTGQ